MGANTERKDAACLPHRTRVGVSWGNETRMAAGNQSPGGVSRLKSCCSHANGRPNLTSASSDGFRTVAGTRSMAAVTATA